MQKEVEVRPRYKNKIAQKAFERYLNVGYPMTAKDGLAGSFSDAFNAGYEGRVGGIYRFNNRYSLSNILYQAGKARKRIDLKKEKGKK